MPNGGSSGIAGLREICRVQKSQNLRLYPNIDANYLGTEQQCPRSATNAELLSKVLEHSISRGSSPTLFGNKYFNAGRSSRLTSVVSEMYSHGYCETIKPCHRRLRDCRNVSTKWAPFIDVALLNSNMFWFFRMSSVATE